MRINLAVLAFVIIAVLAAITVLIAIVVIACTILAAAAVHREERLATLSGRAPGLVARLARSLLVVERHATDGSGPAPATQIWADPDTAGGLPAPADPDAACGPLASGRP